MSTLLHQLAALPLDSAHVPHKQTSGDNRIAGTPLEAILGMEQHLLQALLAGGYRA